MPFGICSGSTLSEAFQIRNMTESTGLTRSLGGPPRSERFRIRVGGDGSHFGAGVGSPVSMRSPRVEHLGIR